MWKLSNIKAQNLCAFKELDLDVPQNVTTLIFGNNLDNDSQGSNGSGKSALIEAIAIGLTGEPLRKVKTEEIINDSEEDAMVCLSLYNDSSNSTLVISRNFSRRSPQSIQIQKDGIDVAQSSVAEYNKYVLAEIGLTKEDLYSNFILSKHKYVPFLSCSDREKKELINRFSNGILVDESIVALQNDIEPLAEELEKAERAVSYCEGSISAVDDQIAKQLSEQENHAQKREEKVTTIKESIAANRKVIRESEEMIDYLDKSWEEIEEMEKRIKEIEDENRSFDDTLNLILAIWKNEYLPDFPDYQELVDESRDEIHQLETKAKELQALITDYEKEVNRAKANLEEVQAKYLKLDNKTTKEQNRLSALIKELKELIAKNNQDLVEIANSKAKLDEAISRLTASLSGKIECPKCHHTWVLGSTLSIQEMQNKLDELTKQLAKLNEERTDKSNSSQDANSQIKEARSQSSKLDDELEELSNTLRSVKIAYNKVSSTLSSLKDELNTVSKKSERLQKRVESIKGEMFDWVYDTVTNLINKFDSEIKNRESIIASKNGAIETLKQSLEQINNASTDNLLESLQKTRKEGELNLNKAVAKRDEIQQALNRLKVQNERFVEFKTYLANSKIEALAQITNEFLQAIGSDIRIAFSGFTTLRTGKVRDKISTSLLRDGIDCGSFLKFSQGEQARVNLANILALQKLTNASCEGGKGLDLLVLDEILDATDESGLASMFDALNHLQITSLVVSHGNIAENYPYKLVINKQYGISTINGNSV